MTPSTSSHKRSAQANAKGNGQAAELACFARPINTISNRSDGDGPQRCQLALDAGFICVQSELPPGPLIVKVSRHLTAVIDGVLYDTHNCSRGGARCVYGYFSQP